MKIVKETDLGTVKFCSQCIFYGKVFGPQCDFRSIISEDLDKYVYKHDGIVDSIRPDACIEKYGE